MRLPRIAGSALMICLVALVAFGGTEHSYQPAAGFVPDKSTAIRIGEAVLIPIYTQAEVESQRPFSAELTGNVWHVTGYLPAGIDGGVAEVWISKRDGRILRVTHGK
jgi:hypothetical protein